MKLFKKKQKTKQKKNEKVLFFFYSSQCCQQVAGLTVLKMASGCVRNFLGPSVGFAFKHQQPHHTITNQCFFQFIIIFCLSSNLEWCLCFTSAWITFSRRWRFKIPINQVTWMYTSFFKIFFSFVRTKCWLGTKGSHSTMWPAVFPVSYYTRHWHSDIVVVDFHLWNDHDFYT